MFERFVLRRMIGRPIFAILMITIGLDILLRTLITIRIGAQYEVPAATPFDIYSGINIGEVHLGTPQLVTIAVTILCVLGLFVFFRYTRYGLAMRATALDQEAALATGIKFARSMRSPGASPQPSRRSAESCFRSTTAQAASTSRWGRWRWRRSRPSFLAAPIRLSARSSAGFSSG